MNESKQAAIYNVEPARAGFSQILDRAAKGERVILSKYNIPVAAMVPISDMKVLESEGSKKNGKEGK